jgi:hypothetical protein
MVIDVIVAATETYQNCIRDGTIMSARWRVDEIFLVKQFNVTVTALLVIIVCVCMLNVL